MIEIAFVFVVGCGMAIVFWEELHDDLR